MRWDELMDLWRETRAPEVSVLADRLSLRLARPLFPKSASGAVRQQRWLAAVERVDEPGVVGTLLDTLHDGFSEDVLRRLEVVAAWGDDPRISSALAQMWEHPAHLNISTTFLWEAIILEQGRRADRRSLQRLEAVVALGDGWAGLFRPHMRPVIPGLLARARAVVAERLSAVKVRPLSDGERRRLAEATPAPGPEEALGAIWANPDDWALRLVYADALSARGDARGEFIALQCLDHRGPEQERRLASLLEQGSAAWAGPLGRIATVDAYEGGFPAAVTVTARSRIQLAPLLGHPCWSTVHTIAPSGHLELVVHPAMSRVLRLSGLTASDVRALARRPRPLGVRSLVFSSAEGLRAFSLLARTDRFPRLAEVHLGATPGPDELGRAQGLARALREARPEVQVHLGPERLEHPARLGEGGGDLGR